MTTLYVAGPMRKRPEFNFPEFLRVDPILVRAGYDTINPAQKDLDQGFVPWGNDGFTETSDPSFSIRSVMKLDCSLICDRCDGIALLDGWWDSKGAKAEVALAEALGLPVAHWSRWANWGSRQGGFVPYIPAGMEDVVRLPSSNYMEERASEQ